MDKPHIMEIDEDDLLGSSSEEAIYKVAYQTGLDEGTKEGGGEGWTVGLKTGASIGFELGRYKGFALAVRETLTTGESGKTQGSSSSRSEESGESATSSSRMKSLRLCERIIKAVDDFDFENITSVHDACSQVRSQVNLLKTCLGMSGASVVDKQSISGQKYSF